MNSPNPVPGTHAPPGDNLPPFLVRQNGRLELHLHATNVQQYKVCQLKFWITNGLELERATPKWSQNYGGAVHEVLAFRYNNLGLSLNAVQDRQVSLLTDWFARTPVDDTEWRNLPRAVQAITAYNSNYPAHDWTVLGVEETFSVEVGTVAMDDDELVNVFLDGRKDLVVAWHDGIWIVDHKTASEWGDDPDKNQELLSGRRSFQFRGYAWAERARQRVAQELRGPNRTPRERLTLPVRGVVGNYIIGRKPFSESVAAAARRSTNGKSFKPRDQWHQEFFTFPDAVLDEWRKQFLLTAARILRDWQAGTWEQSFDRGCAYYGKCPFYEYCEGELPLESAAFRRREPQSSAANEEPV